MQAIAVDAPVKGTGVTIINDAGGVIYTVAIIAKISGAGNAIVTVFRNVNTPATDAAVIGAGIAVIKCASWIKDTTAIDTVVVGAG